MIAAYLEALTGCLAFDPRLARRVCLEVEDHLREAAAAAAEKDAAAAERRAVAQFGEPRAVAAEFALLSAVSGGRRLGAVVFVVIAGVFLAMKARAAWYVSVAWAVREDLKTVSAVVESVDRIAFWLAVLAGLSACIYVFSRPMTVDPRRGIAGFLRLCSAGTAALIVAVIADGTLTGLRLSGGAEISAAAVPVASLSLEIAAAGLLVGLVRRLRGRIRATAALLDP